MGRNFQIILGPAHEGSANFRKFQMRDFWNSNQKTREGCSCPKLFPRRFSRQISTLLESSSLIFRQCVLLSLPRFGHCPVRKMAAGNGPCLRACSWIFSSETATAFLSFSDQNYFFMPILFCESAALNSFSTKDVCITHAGFLEVDSQESFLMQGVWLNRLNAL